MTPEAQRNLSVTFLPPLPPTKVKFLSPAFDFRSMGYGKLVLNAMLVKKANQEGLSIVNVTA